MKNAPVQVSNESALVSANSTPRLPANNTQPSRLLAALLRGETVNPLHGWRALGIYRLSDTVLRLRKIGWPVITNRLDVANRFNEQCHVAAYSLPSESIIAAGNEGQQFAATELASMIRRKVA